DYYCYSGDPKHDVF
nr:immunoglobulin light chain junction region [Macaca mulatta]MOW56529.1 immunoglobulin light chain junction region [Macaca mulatta]MOW56978.1 immunoglobulin light chain junction region [Macaca mulatta]MOW57764.1 immunoglobulin light chain junction region [Macaca mulatta]MOW58864.1 immunoglobulin light chain junction region [Macaca mulatta]